MSSQTAQPDPHAAILEELIALGQDLARQVHAAAGTDIPLEAATVAFDRVARAVRRTVALARRLHETAQAAETAQAGQAAARRRIIRTVEDTITRDAPGDRDALERELQERLDAPELEDEIGRRPTQEIIDDIVRDLGLARMPGCRNVWTRRTPADVRTLHARSARPPGRTAEPRPDPRTFTSRASPLTPTPGAGTVPACTTTAISSA